MTDQDNADPWASLASELGIEPPVGQSEAQPQAVEPVPVPAPPSAAKAPPRKPTERIRPASDWDALASELGIPPESLPRVQPAPVPTRHAEPAARHAEPVARQDEPAPRAEPIVPLEAFASVEPEIHEPSVFGEEAGGFAETVDLMEDTIEFAERAPETPESAAESEEQRTSRRRRKRRRRGRGGSRTDATEPAAEQTDLALPAASEEVPAAETAGEENAEIATGDAVVGEVPADEAGDDEQSGRRRSRRSGRRRKRRPEGAEPREKTAGEPAAEAEAESGAREARPPRDFRPERSEFAPHDDADDEFADEAGDDKELRVGHRAIPTWDEAVGLIIAKNMESRAKRPNGGQSRGHGGRDRRGGQRRPPRGN